MLASHFIEIAVKELGCARPTLTQAGIETLLHYDWPGNIRELCNVIQRAAIFAQGGALEFDLPMRKAQAASTSPRSESGDGDNAEYLTEAEVRRRERENLLIVLQKTDLRIKGVDGAAELLGIKPTTLMSRIEKLGLRRPPSPSRLATPGEVPLERENSDTQPPAPFAGSPGQPDCTGKSVSAITETALASTFGYVIAESGETDNTLCIVTFTNAPGEGPPPHTHTVEDETFIVHEGELEFYQDGRTFTGHPSDVIYLVRGKRHYFKVISGNPTKYTVVCVPAGFDRFFREAAVESKKLQPDIATATLIGIGAKYGIHIEAPPAL